MERFKLRSFHLSISILCKNLSNFVSPLENLTTYIAIISANGNCCQYGSRIPAVFAKQANSSSQCLEFRSSVSGNGDYRFDFYYQLNQLYHIEISQENIHGETVMYNVKIDGTTKHSVENTQVQVFDQVKLYLSSPWLETFGPYGEVRNLEVVNGKPTETPGKLSKIGHHFSIDCLLHLIFLSFGFWWMTKGQLI